MCVELWTIATGGHGAEGPTGNAVLDNGPGCHWPRRRLLRVARLGCFVELAALESYDHRRLAWRAFRQLKAGLDNT